MGELTSGIISGMVWDAMKKGISITTDYLRGKLSGWLLDDVALEKIKECVCDIPEACLKSEGLIKEYINLNENILSILKSAESRGANIIQNVEKNEGIVAGIINGTVNNEVNVNNYGNMEKPRNTNGTSLMLIGTYSKFKPIQIVRSFSSTRGSCIIEKDNPVSLYADIVIPRYVKEKEGCQFAMVLFSYIPSENWENYFDEGYRMEFGLELSNNIKLVQLQVKDSRQNQFIDTPIKQGRFSYSLAEMSSRETWKDIREICFTVFADDEYIMGEKGFMRIQDFKLTK